MEIPAVHICIASGQNLPNLIPALQYQAQKVFIIETSEMSEKTGNLSAALKPHGIEVERIFFDDSTPEKIIASAQEIAIKLGENPIVFNATGGHKLMLLALTSEMQQLAGNNMHLIYCETRHNRIDQLLPIAIIDPMCDLLKLDDYLITQGYRIKHRQEHDVKWMNDADQRVSLTRKMGDEADKLARFFGALNRLADKALANGTDGSFRPVQEFKPTPGGRNAELIRNAEKLGLLKWNGKAEVVFSNAEAAQYFRGGWVEEYIWLKLRMIKPTDYAINLEIENIIKHTPNELDAVLVHRNRMLIVECKSKRFGQNQGKDTDHIYKLAQLKQQLAGTMGRALLLSARPVNQEIKDRAAEYKIDVLAGEEIKQVAAYFKKWMIE